jgi:hypothetical protein
MSAGIEIYNYVSNQKGSPALYSDILANRPAAGFLGRLFISTDTLEIYRDTGTAWALISSGGGGVNIYNSDGTLTAARTMTMANHSLTFEGGANDARLIMSANNNVPRIFSFRTANVARWDFRVTDNETGSDAGGNWYLRAHNDAGAFTFAPIAANRKTGEKTLFAQANITAGTEAVTSVFNIAGITYASGLTMIGGNAHAAQFNNFTLANSGSLTFANSSFVGANGNVLRLQANNSGTITMQAATPGLRTAAVSLNQIQYNTTNGSAITYTHAANIQGLGILRLFAAGSLTVTNAYGLLINDLNEYGYPSTGAGALSITNRWGIYQDSTTDANYLGGSVLIGTTTNAGFKTDINGTFRAVSTVTLSSLGGVGTRMVIADASGVLSTQAIPGGGGISGSGTTNYVAKFTGASSIGNSQLFDNGTNVGIGTITPAYLLDVNGEARIQNTLYTRSGTNVAIQMASTSAIRSTGTIYLDYATSGTGSFFIRGGASLNDVMSCFASGNVSIGTTIDAGYKTDIAGTLRATQSAYFATASGNVGIGTLTPSARLENYTSVGTKPTLGDVNNNYNIVSGDTRTGTTPISSSYATTLVLASNTDSVSANNGGSIGFQGKWNSALYSSQAQFSSIFGGKENSTDGNLAGYLSIATRPAGGNPIERLRVTSAGNVGIGTTNPSVNLQIGDISTGTGQRTILLTDPNYGLRLQGGGSSSGSIVQSVGAGVNLLFRSSNSNNTNYIFDSSGNTLFGTSTDSGQKVQVAGTARIYGTALPHLLIEQTAATGNVELQFSANASYLAIIRTQTGQSIGFRDGLFNSNLDIYPSGQISIGGGGAPFGSTNTLTVLAGTAPTATASDCFTLYSKDITAGNAAPHFITENGAIVKIYQETTSVAAAAFTANTGTAINDASTFDGYTLRQIVKALRNLGILQ